MTSTKVLVFQKHTISHMMQAPYLQSDKALKTSSKQLNKNLPNFLNWLREKSRKLKIDRSVKVKSDGQRPVPTCSVKHLGIFIDEHFYRNDKLLKLEMRPNWFIAILGKLRINANFRSLKTEYRSLSEPGMWYTTIGLKEQWNYSNILKVEKETLFGK